MTDKNEEKTGPESAEPLLMTPDLQFSVLCDDVRQEANGKLILIGLFEAIRTKVFPVRHPMLFIVNRWRNGLSRQPMRSSSKAPKRGSPYPAHTPATLSFIVSQTFFLRRLGRFGLKSISGASCVTATRSGW